MFSRWIVDHFETVGSGLLKHTCAGADKAKVVPLTFLPSKFVLRRGENSFFENSGGGGGGLPLLISGAAKQTLRPRASGFGRNPRNEICHHRCRPTDSEGEILSNSSLVLPSSESPADQPSILLTLPYFGAGIDSVLAAQHKRAARARPILQFFKHSPPVVGWLLLIFAGRPQSILLLNSFPLHFTTAQSPFLWIVGADN